MPFIILLIALAVERWTDIADQLRGINLIEIYLKVMKKFAKRSGFKNESNNYAITLILVVIITGFLHLLLDATPLAILGNIFSLFVLLICFEPSFYKLNSAENKNHKPTWMAANHNTFGVIFWFMLLGPTGAVLYRVNEQLSFRQTWKDVQETAQYLQQILDWVPVRLLSVSFALMGHFSEVMRIWWDGVWTGIDNNQDLLNNCGEAALQHATTEKKSAYRLLNLALLLWLVVIGLVALF